MRDGYSGADRRLRFLSLSPPRVHASSSAARVPFPVGGPVMAVSLPPSVLHWPKSPYGLFHKNETQFSFSPRMIF